MFVNTAELCTLNFFLLPLRFCGSMYLSLDSGSKRCSNNFSFSLIVILPSFLLELFLGGTTIIVNNQIGPGQSQMDTHTPPSHPHLD